MRSVGVRELKARTSEVLRRVHDEREIVAVTLRGRVIAHLVPVDGASKGREEFGAVWADMDRLAAEIGARRPKGVSAADAVKEDRREL